MAMITFSYKKTLSRNNKMNLKQGKKGDEL